MNKLNEIIVAGCVLASCAVLAEPNVGGGSIRSFAREPSISVIGDALVRWPVNHRGLAVLPSGIRRIEGNAFSSCLQLTGVLFPDSVKMLEGSAFMFCDGLCEIEIPPTITFLGESVFESCRSLTNVVIRSDITEVPARMCQSCIRLNHVVLPGGLKRIGGCAFSGCRSLKSLKIPYGVESIDAEAFRGCSRLQEIDFPETVREIGANAFSECYDLVSLPTNCPAAAVAMKACGVGLRSVQGQDWGSLKSVMRLAADGFTAHRSNGSSVRLSELDSYAVHGLEIEIGTDPEVVSQSAASLGISCGKLIGSAEIVRMIMGFGYYEKEAVEVSIEIDGGKVSDIKLSEGFKKGVRFGLEENAEVSGEKIARWL